MSRACPSHTLTWGGLLRGLPFSLAGILVGLLSLGKPRIWRGLLVFHGRYGAAWLLLTRRNFSAITLGRVVITPEPELPAQTLVHEQHHAMQFEHGGLLFAALYLYWQVRKGYWRNPFELAAVDCAARYADSLTQAT